MAGVVRAWRISAGVWREVARVTAALMKVECQRARAL
jgi:hypothetical protein